MKARLALFLFATLLATQLHAAEPDLSGLAKFKGQYLWAKEFEMDEVILERLLPYFNIEDAEISKLDHKGQALAIMKDLRLTKKMKLRQDIDPDIYEMFDKLTWFDGGECVEFKHIRPVDDAVTYVKDIYIFAKLGGFQHRLLDPFGKDQSGGWFSRHVHFSKTQAPHELDDFMAVFDLRTAMNYMQQTTPEFAFSGGFAVYKDDIRSKGANRLVSEKRGELRRSLWPPHEQILDVATLLEEGPERGKQKLLDEISSKIKKENVDWVFDHATADNQLDWLMKLYVTLEKDRPQVLLQIFSPHRVARIRPALDFYKAFNSEARAALHLKPVEVFYMSAVQLQEKMRMEILRLMNENHLGPERARIFHSLKNYPPKALAALLTPSLVQALGRRLGEWNDRAAATDLATILSQISASCGFVFRGI